MTARSIAVTRRWTSVALPVALSGALLALAACNQDSAQHGSSLPVGSIQDNPQSGLKFIVDSNKSGEASLMRVSAVEWGRLVDVYAQDPINFQIVPVFDDLLIGADVQGNGFDFTLIRQPGSGTEILTILHPIGSPQFLQTFAELDDTLQLVIDKSLNPNELPPYTAVPRNAAMMITFDDLIDASSINGSTIQVSIGYPPVNEFIGRIMADNNHGDVIDGVFHTTRIIVDLTVSLAEAAQSSLPVNAIGLPEAINAQQPGVALRIPTRTVPGSQAEVLVNLSGHAVSFNGNGSTDPFSDTLDVVRAFRAGGRTTVTGDPFNGFLPDDVAPQIVSSQAVQLTQVFAISTGYLIDFFFASPGCAVQPQTGDIIAMQSGVFARVTQTGPLPAGGIVQNVHVEVIEPVGGILSLGNGDYRQPWTKSVDQAARPECWVQIQPPPANGVDTGIKIDSTFTLQFSEAMDPAQLNGFDTFQLLYGISTPTALQAQVVGETTANSDVTRFMLVPSLPLRHAAGGTETFRVNLPFGTTGAPIDLAGNAVQTPLTDSGGGAPAFTLLATEPAIESRSLALRFTALDEDPGTNPAGNEVRGQVIPDLLNGRLRPRSVTRISGVCDQNTPMMQFDMGPAPVPAPFVPATLFASAGPFVPQGSRWMTVWRYADLGFTIPDDTTHNLDVEGLNWSPSVGGLQFDFVPEFQMSLSHSFFLPDEGTDPMAGILHPNSSISDTFANNILPGETLQNVHAKPLGYTVQPGDLFTASTGTKMAPWPLNQNVPVSNFQLFTWRDTGKIQVGQPNTGGGSGEGVKLHNERAFDPVPPLQWYSLGNVPTIGLPLLMDFRTYTNTAINGTNRLLGVMVIALPPPATATEVAPFFTAYSQGGVPVGTGIPVNVDPDLEIIAQGGVPSGAVGVLPRNQFIMFGQGDFVTRVSRAHTRWFECAPNAAGSGFQFAEPVIDPPISQLPAGTQVVLHFRGASSFNNTTGTKPYEIAQNLDAYGDRSPAVVDTFTPVFFPPVGANQPANQWYDTMAAIDGAQFFQCRVTMIANIVSGVTPDISSLGFAFAR